MEEIRMMPISRFVVMCDLLSEESGAKSGERVRDATQADIDALLA